NFASIIRFVSLSILRVSLRASPQTMLPTSPMASGFSISPTFFGCRKRFLTLSVYSHMLLFNKIAELCQPLHLCMSLRDTLCEHRGGLPEGYLSLSLPKN